ncbi:Uncharacterised protein [uncultured archaeon]|nr:Uncharacterised protein [uncultured archaeon]
MTFNPGMREKRLSFYTISAPFVIVMAAIGASKSLLDAVESPRAMRTIDQEGGIKYQHQRSTSLTLDSRISLDAASIRSASASS